VWSLAQQSILIQMRLDALDIKAEFKFTATWSAAALEWWSIIQAWRSPGHTAAFDPLNASVAASTMTFEDAIVLLKRNIVDNIVFLLIDKGAFS
jgi:hypothetical protein